MARIHRRFFLQQSAAVGAALLARTTIAKSTKGVNEKLNLGFIGAGGRANELLKQFRPLPDVRIAAICDVDEERLSETAGKYSGATKYGDLRKLVDDKDIDAVVIATCNHWHALAAILAMQVGKDVYVEKPLSHNHWEGQQVVNAARKLDRIVQLGTQQRSDPMQAEIKEFLHDKKALGKIEYVQVCRFGPRLPIGKRSTPLQPPKTVNYDLWLGPAQEQPIYRDKLHYDWHWDWNTGNGELGNWGVHVLDDALNVALRDECPFPKRVAAAGGRVAWHDAGNTPNVVFAYYDTGTIPVLFGLSNLPDGTDAKKGPKVEDVGTGYIVMCEGGYYEGGRGGGKARDKDGKVIRKFKGDSGAGHARNFVDAVFAHDRKQLNAEIEIGHQSTAWCNLADVAQRAGDEYSHERALSVRQDFEPWDQLVELIEKHLQKNSVDLENSKFQLGPVLEFDSKAQKFVGSDAKKANSYLQREYRKGFEVPELS
jgi:predicted dehydrogenase